MGPYTINVWWLIALVFVPFILGLLTGIRTVKRAITLKLLEKLSIDEFKDITGWTK